MATWPHRLSHPVRTARNAAWQARAVLAALRRQFGAQPPWVVARNRRLSTVAYGPPNIFVEPTNACNLRCPLCPTGRGEAVRPLGMMDPALLEKIVSGLSHRPRQFGFWLAGEPLLHPQIARMVAFAAKAGLRPSMHTNATRLTPELAADLVRAGLDHISISFDGDDADTYERMRPPARHADTIACVRELAAVRAALGSPTPRIVVQTIIPYAGPEVHPYGMPVVPAPAFVNQFAGARIDEFRALLAHSWSGQIDGTPGAAPTHRDTGRRWVCLIPWTDLTIAWNGDAVTCCGDLAGLNVLGNLRDSTVDEVWNGPGYRRFREAMSGPAIEKWPLCGRCERIWTEPPNPDDWDLRFEMLRHRLRF